MFTPIPFHRSRACLAALALAAGSLCTAQAVAQQDADALKGPRVKDNSVPGQVRPFASKGRGQGQPRDMRPGAFVRALATLEADDAPADVRLTEEQRQQLRDIRSEFETSMQAYRQAHQQEIEQLRQALPQRDQRRIDGFLRGPRDGAGAPAHRVDAPVASQPDDMMADGTEPAQRLPAQRRRPQGEASASARAESGTDALTPEAQAARERLREILEGAPKAVDTQAKVMAMLTEPQKAHVKQAIERSAQERDQREQRGQRPSRGDESDAERTRMLSRLSPEEREALKAMSPEQRREFMRKKIGQRRDEAAAPSPDKDK